MKVEIRNSTLQVITNQVILHQDLKQVIADQLNLQPEEFYLVHNGKKIADNVPVDTYISIILRVCGGKGGFGSMLRAIGAQIEKTTNREACRDLSGRRLRDINEEKRLKNWIASQTDREQEAQDRKQKKLERLSVVPKHKFEDEEYEKSRSELAEKVSDAVEQGFKNAASTSTVSVAPKRKVETKGNKAKKSKLWVDADLSDLSEGSSDEEVSEQTPKAISV